MPQYEDASVHPNYYINLNNSQFMVNQTGFLIRVNCPFKDKLISQLNKKAQVTMRGTGANGPVLLYSPCEEGKRQKQNHTFIYN